MKILLLTQYYPPETGAAQNRLSDLMQRLAAKGHAVSVLTALPNYPKGRIFEGYRGKFAMSGCEAGVQVVRVWCYATSSKRFLLRMVNYLSFVVTSLLAGITRIPRQDYIVVESPPLFLGFSGIVLSFLKRSAFVLNVSYLWPESALALGVVKRGLLFNVAKAFEEFLYRRSLLIGGQAQGIVDDIQKRFPQKRVLFLPNGISAEKQLDENARREARQRVRREWELETKFIVGYTGLHGLAQGLDVLLGAAEHLQGNGDIVFLFFGDGPEKAFLSKLATDKKLSNVRFFPPQPASRMPEIMAGLDTAIVPLRKVSLFKGVLPAKLFECLGSGVASVVAIDGEARQIVEQAQAGIWVEPENPDAMAAAILKLYADPQLRQAMGENGKRYITRYYNRGLVADALEQELAQHLGRPVETAKAKAAAQGTS